MPIQTLSFLHIQGKTTIDNNIGLGLFGAIV